jgi:hypothetical protein
VKKNNTCSLNTFDIDRLEIFTEKSITQDIWEHMGTSYI